MGNQNAVSMILASVFILLYCCSSGWHYSYSERYKANINDYYEGSGLSIKRAKQPPVILLDINGDNEEELIAVTSNMVLRIYQLKHTSSLSYGVSNQLSYKEVSLLSNVQLHNNVAVVAMTAERLQMDHEAVGVVVVLNNHGIISCYSDSMKLLWKVSIYESSLINMSNLIISNSALSIEKRGSQYVVYVTISYSMSRKHLLRALNERLTSEEIAILKENHIKVGNDVDLSSHLNNPYYYVLEKYKSFYDKLVSINELKVLTLNAETGDVIWRNSLSPQIKSVSFYPQQQPIMNAEDSERKYDDISDYSQSMMHFFPHFYHSAKDSSIATQLYCRNVYHTHSDYMDSRLRSLLPIDFLTTFVETLHKNHLLLRTLPETNKTETGRRVVVVHMSAGIRLLDAESGRHVSDIPLMGNQMHAAISTHFGDVVSFFVMA